MRFMPDGLNWKKSKNEAVQRKAPAPSRLRTSHGCIL